MLAADRESYFADDLINIKIFKNNPAATWAMNNPAILIIFLFAYMFIVHNSIIT